MTVRRLQQMQREFDRRGTRAEFLVIGYDPERDDAPAWHQDRETRHLTGSNWHFLIGKIRRVAPELEIQPNQLCQLLLVKHTRFHPRQRLVAAPPGAPPLN